MGVKMNLRIITKYHESDLEIRFLTKSILKPYGRETAKPPAWELNYDYYEYLLISNSYRCASHFPHTSNPSIHVRKFLVRQRIDNFWYIDKHVVI